MKRTSMMKITMNKTKLQALSGMLMSQSAQKSLKDALNAMTSTQNALIVKYNTVFLKSMASINVFIVVI